MLIHKFAIVFFLIWISRHTFESEQLSTLEQQKLVTTSTDISGSFQTNNENFWKNMEAWKRSVRWSSESHQDDKKDRFQTRGKHT